MTKSTTKSENNPPAQGNGKEETRSVFSRVSQWLTAKKEKPEDNQVAPQPPAEPGQSTQISATPPLAVSNSGPESATPQGKLQTPAGDSMETKNTSSTAPPQPPNQETKPATAADNLAETGAASGKETESRPNPQKRSRMTKKRGKRPRSGTPDSRKEKAPASGSPKYKLLINADEPEECRIVLLDNGRVESFYVETVSRAQTKGNIYKGRISAVEPNLQAAFVDIGLAKNGFLPFSDIHPEYYYKSVEPDTHWKDLHIQDVIRKGQEVLVEVVKEEAGTKGATVTTYLSLPGRYLVLMPGSDSAGISRKIDNEEQRAKLREMVQSLKLPEGIGYIVRTASQEITKTALSQDMRYLLNLWKKIKKRGQSLPAPSVIYREQNIIARFLRDHYTTDIHEILVDDKEAHSQVLNFLDLLPPAQRKTTAVRMHTGSQPLFHHYHVEKQIEQIYQPTVSLPSGGSIVINPTEALVAIDVNSGRTSKDKNFEETIFLANMEAAEELARQLRLRDLGGLIVVDFIDMRESRHIREVEKKVKVSMKKDKAKVDFSRISKFGLMQISRQKLSSPIQMGSYKICPHCHGRGMVRSVETLALVHLRHIQTGAAREDVKRVECRLPMEVAQYLLNKKRHEIIELEERYKVAISITPDPALKPAEKFIDFVKG